MNWEFDFFEVGFLCINDPEDPDSKRRRYVVFHEVGKRRRRWHFMLWVPPPIKMILSSAVGPLENKTSLPSCSVHVYAGPNPLVCGPSAHLRVGPSA